MNKAIVTENFGLQLGELNPKMQISLSIANYDDSYQEGKNFVFSVGPEDMKNLRDAYGQREDDPQWLLHMFMDNDIKFPGFKKIADFIDNSIDGLTLFKDDNWTKYFVFILEVIGDETFKMRLSMVPDLDESELPVPFDNFKRMFFALEREMPKIIWRFNKDKETRDAAEKRQHRHGKIKDFLGKGADIKQKIEQAGATQ